jgi:ribosome-associated heat shock protein Hsp15
MDIMADGGRVRIDKWLWAARFFKTRTLAAEAIELGRVRVGGARIKPSREARIGDRIEVLAGDHAVICVIRALSAQRGPAPIAQLLYEETDDSRARRQRQRELARYGAEPARSIKGRPTKREGRLLRTARETSGEAD